MELSEIKEQKKQAQNQKILIFEKMLIVLSMMIVETFIYLLNFSV